jgi:hypothetical protein
MSNNEVLTLEADLEDPMREDVHDDAVKELALRDTAAIWIPSFTQTVDDAIKFQDDKRRFMQHVLKEGVHYMTLPGSAKPSLLKPGAEALNAAMGLHPILSDAETPIIDLMGTLYGGEAHIRFRRICKIYKQIGTRELERMLVSQAEGLCNSWEVKYRYRDEQLKCPACGKNTIIKGKEEYGGGFICWKKKGGCDAKFRLNDKSITEQVTGRIPNPEPGELINTILKMADKRALVATTLLATGCSDIFTQDLEDSPIIDVTPEAAAEKESRPAASTRTTKPKEEPPLTKESVEKTLPNTPAAAKPKVGTDAADKSAQDKTRNSWVGRLTTLEDELSLSAQIRLNILRERYNATSKRSLNSEQMMDYAAWLKEQRAQVDEYYSKLADEVGPEEAAAIRERARSKDIRNGN